MSTERKGDGSISTSSVARASSTACRATSCLTAARRSSNDSAVTRSRRTTASTAAGKDSAAMFAMSMPEPVMMNSQHAATE